MSLTFLLNSLPSRYGTYAVLASVSSFNPYCTAPPPPRGPPEREIKEVETVVRISCSMIDSNLFFLIMNVVGVSQRMRNFYEMA